METLQIFQQLAPDTVMAALLALPWAALAVLHTFGAAARGNHDDDWSDRALAAVRWAGVVIEPLQRQDIAVRRVAAARAPVRRAQDQQRLPHAA